MSEVTNLPAVVDEPRELRPSQDVVATRAAKEVEAAMIVAKRFPRNEFDSIEKIKQACKREGLAKESQYSYSRGGTTITGASVDLLRAIKMYWGNVTSGWQEISRRFGSSTVYAYAWDLETNARCEITFEVKHIRDKKGGGVQLTDERDIYELIANQAARRERKCLEGVIPKDIVELAVEDCDKTLAGKNDEPIRDRLQKVVTALREVGVTAAMVEKRLQHKMEAVSEIELAGLRKIWKSLHDGVGRVEDFFDQSEAAAPSGDQSGKSKSDKIADELAGRVAKGKKAKAPDVQPIKPANWVEHFKGRISAAFEMSGDLREAALTKVFNEIQDPENETLSEDEIVEL